MTWIEKRPLEQPGLVKGQAAVAKNLPLSTTASPCQSDTE